MADFKKLIENLARVTGLPDDLAEAVVETAVEYVKEKRPDKADEIDAQLSDEKTADRAAQLIGKMSKKAQVPEE